MRRSIALVLVVIVMFGSLSPGLRAQQPVADAEVQAEADVNRMLWIGAGFLLGPIGWFIGTQHNPEPPASALLGKSPAYVAQYRDAYKRRANQIASKNSLIGCGVGAAAGILLVVLAAASTASVYDY